MSKRSTYFWVALAITAFLTACSSPYGSPKNTINTMRKAAEKGNEKGVMNCYTTETLKLMKKMEELSKDVDSKDQDVNKMEEFKNATVQFVSEKIDGDHATATVKINNMQIEYTFLKEKGDWKIDQSKELAAGVQMLEGMKSMKGGLDNFLKAIGGEQ